LDVSKKENLNNIEKHFYKIVSIEKNPQNDKIFLNINNVLDPNNTDRFYYNNNTHYKRIKLLIHTLKNN